MSSEKANTGVVPGASCPPGDIPVGKTEIKNLPNSIQVRLTGGKCFDQLIEEKTFQVGWGQLEPHYRECESLDVQPALSKLLGHGLLKAAAGSGTTVGIDSASITEQGACSWSTNYLENKVKTDDYSGFTIGIDYSTISETNENYQSVLDYVQSQGATDLKMLDGLSDYNESYVIHTGPNSAIYGLVVSNGNGTAVQLYTGSKEFQSALPDVARQALEQLGS